MALCNLSKNAEVVLKYLMGFKEMHENFGPDLDFYQKPLSEMDWL